MFFSYETGSTFLRMVNNLPIPESFGVRVLFLILIILINISFSNFWILFSFDIYGQLHLFRTYVKKSNNSPSGVFTWILPFLSKKEWSLDDMMLIAINLWEELNSSNSRLTLFINSILITGIYYQGRSLLGEIVRQMKSWIGNLPSTLIIISLEFWYRPS